MGKEHWLPEGSLLHEKYYIKKILGQGGFGITYQAYDTVLQQNVAIKEYFPVRYANRLRDCLNRTSEEKMEKLKLSAASIVYPKTGQEKNYLKGMQNFLEEARLLFGKFDIEGVVSVRDFFEENGTAYIVMEYLSGMTLREYEKQNKGQINEKEAWILLKPVIKALSYLHSVEIIHCDISPDNMLFDREGNLKLIDFGAARKREYSEEETYYKESYTPPEQYYDVKIIGPWTDIYALCAVWYELLTGSKVPSAVERMKKDRLKPISETLIVSAQTEAIIQRGLSLEIPKRYFCAVNLYFEMKKSKEIGGEINKAGCQADPNSIDTEQKAEIDLEKYLTDTRKRWGDLWLQITTEVNERNITQKGKWLSKRRIKYAVRMIAVVILMILLAGIGRESYIQIYPEKYFAYKVKKRKEYYLLHPRKKEYTNQLPEYRKMVKNIKSLSYKVEEEKESYCRYELSEKNLKKLGLVSNKYGTLPLLEKDMEKAIMAFMHIKGSDIESISTDYENNIIQRRWGKKVDLEVDAKKQKDITYANQEELKIIYDPVDLCVYEISFTGRFKRTKRFLQCMQPLLCSENYLTDVECRSIFQKVKEEKETIGMYDMGPDYDLELDYDDNDYNPYTEYKVEIKANSFISGFY